MLSELPDLQESNERVWGTAKISFTVETRSEEDGDLIQREYTFSLADHFDMWTFHKFEEKKTPDTPEIRKRNWRRTRHLTWDDSEAPSVEVPPEVSDELEEMLGLDSMVLQNP